MSGITTKNVLKYTLLPGIVPRAQRLFGSGFAHLAFLMAQIYVAVGLLPATHPYNNPENIGRYGIRHVIAESANHLVLSRKNIDKILIFFAILAGALLLFAQIILFIAIFMIDHAWAGAIAGGGGGAAFPGFVNIFDTANADTDLAFSLLAEVFGVPDFFCSPITGTCSENNAQLPYPIHNGLHALFGFYSFGLLLIGMLIFLYYLVVIVAESAATGSPFGQRFKNVWVPIRLIVAIGLLVPLNYKLNSGQYLTLYSAKLGSSMATNGWYAYNNAIADHALFSGGGQNPSGELETLIGMPKKQSISEVVEFMSIVHTCAYTYWRENWLGENGNIITFGANHYQNPNAQIHAFFAKTDPDGGSGVSEKISAGTEYTKGLDFYNNGNIHIIFGDEIEGSDEEYRAKGGIKPFCGEIVIPVGDVKNKGDGDTLGGSDKILETYFNLVMDLWFRASSPVLRAGAIRITEIEGGYTATVKKHACSGEALMGAPYLPAQCDTVPPGSEWVAEMKSTWQPGVDANIAEAWTLYVQNEAEIEIEAEILERGWAGAGMWFNRIADLNGKFMTAVLNIPRVQRYPLTMEETRAQKMQTDANLTNVDIFSPVLEGKTEIELGTDKNLTRAKVLSKAYKIWNEDNQSDDTDTEATQNIFMDTMTMILGVDGIFDIRGENAPTHPLAQLAIVGKGLVESTIRNLAVATASSFLGGIMGAAKNAGGAAIMGSISSFFTSTAFLGLTAGVVLYYIVPFLPFVYFIFAVGTWLKTIFEAMVGVPLWALAHLRIDGEGLPGDSAQNGYFLILEIGIRPLLILFGLIAALTIFTAQVRVLNFIWDLVIQNTGGYTDDNLLQVHDEELNVKLAYKRGIIDQFFFTIIYTIIVYMLATACFKMIDDIPNNILRWMGASATSFGDKNSDAQAVDSLGRYVAISGMVQGQQLAGVVPQLAQGVGGTGGKMLFGSRGTPPNLTGR